jgi:leucyl aminopeptidase (aminopeptidase T)
MVDEGASVLGEVALIPYDSPISNQKILYYETLFDENASCHLAYGAAYPCIAGGNDMSDEELKAHGVVIGIMPDYVRIYITHSNLTFFGGAIDVPREKVLECWEFKYY